MKAYVRNLIKRVRIVYIHNKNIFLIILDKREMEAECLIIKNEDFLKALKDLTEEFPNCEWIINLFK